MSSFKVLGSSNSPIKTTALVNNPGVYAYGSKGIGEAAIAKYIPQGDKRFDLYRTIHMYDAVSGGALDLMSELPFSELSLAGVNDPVVMRIFENTMHNLRVPSLAPDVTKELLKMGFVVGTCVFDEASGIFTDIILQEPENCEFTPVPLQGYDPKIDIKVSQELKAFMSSQDPRDAEAQKEIPDKLRKQILSSNKIPLESSTTLYIARKTYPTDIGTSYLLRTVPFYILEQVLLEGTITAAKRRQKPVTHITAGDEDWEPSEQELGNIVDLFMAADMDPIGAFVATKRGIDLADVRPPSDIWKITEDWEILSQAKMRALGINEAFLTGDATYNTMEAALSVFIETMKTLRAMVTYKMFYEKIFPMLSRAHRFIKRKPSELDHRIRTTGSLNKIPLNDLIIPDIKWQKQLQPQYDQSFFDSMAQLEAQSIPVPIRYWTAAGGLDINKILDSQEEDLAIRKQLQEYNEQINELGGGGGEEGGGGMEWGIDRPIKPKKEKKKPHKITANKVKALDTMARANKRDPKQIDRIFRKLVPDIGKTGMARKVLGDETLKLVSNR